MSHRVSLHGGASAEWQAAARWYETQRGGVGVEFSAAVEETIRRIAAWPYAARLVDGLKSGLVIRRAPVSGFPYNVFYLEEPSGFVVLAVAHNRRRPGYWLKRLRKA